MPYATVSDYPAMRAALDVTLDATRLPDSTIASAPYHPAAEAEAARRLGTYAAAAASPVQPAATRAVVLLTAARLLPALPNVTQRRLLDTSFTFAPQAIKERVAALRADAARELAEVIRTLDPAAVQVAPPTHFAVAPGGRAQGVYAPAAEA